MVSESPFNGQVFSVLKHGTDMAVFSLVRKHVFRTTEYKSALPKPIYVLHFNLDVEKLDLSIIRKEIKKLETTKRLSFVSHMNNTM